MGPSSITQQAMLIINALKATADLNYQDGGDTPQPGLVGDGPDGFIP